tara:strand:+ start:59426 stop:60646 length:1221 start_codon:yes stop_codon:yes gene_type:complete
VRVLHILYQSLPQVSGSSIRSRDILFSQKSIGIVVSAITSPFQHSISGEKEDVIDGIRYIRTSRKKVSSISDEKKSVFHQLAKLFSILTFSFSLYKTVKKEKPDILHAHAMFFCGIPTLIIGKLTGLPVVYEFRSLWMFQKKFGKKTRLETTIETFLLKAEIFTLKRADHAVFLNEKLKEYFISLGHSFANSSIVNNAVNTQLIKEKRIPIPVERETPVFGYIGTLTAYEGIEFLIESFQELADEGFYNKLIIYGTGISEKNIVETIKKRPDLKNIQFKGSIHPSEVNKAFSKIDVIINPRLSNDVTNAVTPLKPLEAMAYHKIVIGSDVGGILELLTNNKNGFIFKAEDKNSLKETIIKVAHLKENEKKNIINTALTYVVENKSWIHNAHQYENAYSSLLENNQG